MTSNKRQKITEAMSLLDDEKEALSSNTYVRVADALADSYKAVEDLYVLKWMSIVPVVQDDEGGDRVIYKQNPRSSILPLTLEQVNRIKRMIQSGTNYDCSTDTLFWDDIDYTSVPLFGQHLRIDGEDKDTNIHETSVLLSLVEYTGQ